MAFVDRWMGILSIDTVVLTRGHAVRSQDLVEVSAAAALTVSMLAGKLALPRLFGSAEISPLWLEIRFPALLIAIALAALTLSGKGLGDVFRPVTNAVYFWFCILALIAFLILRSIGLAGSEPSIIDCLYLIAQICVLAIVIQSPLAIAAMGGTAFATALFLFLLALVGVNKAELNGPGWAPIGGIITFYRIEFLGLCVCLYYYLKSEKLIALPLIGIFFFGTLAALSKAAILAAILSLAIVAIPLITKRRFVVLGLLIVTLAIAFGAWYHRFSAPMALRVSEAFTVGSTDTAAADHQIPFERKIPLERDGRQINKSRTGLIIGQEMRVTFDFCTSPDKCSMKEIIDRSGRAVLFAFALEGFIKSPLIGRGLGQYLIESQNRYTGEMQSYKYPHDIVAELMFAGGLVALFLLSIIICMAVVISVRAVGRSLPAAAITSVAAFIFLTALAAGDLYDIRLALCAVLVLGSKAVSARAQT